MTAPDAGTLPVMDANGNPLRPHGASWVGAVDLAGNVWEWVNSLRRSGFSQQSYDFLKLYPYPYIADDGRE